MCTVHSSWQVTVCIHACDWSDIIHECSIYGLHGLRVRAWCIHVSICNNVFGKYERHPCATHGYAAPSVVKIRSAINFSWCGKCAPFSHLLRGRRLRTLHFIFPRFCIISSNSISCESHSRTRFSCTPASLATALMLHACLYFILIQQIHWYILHC